ncbi:dynamin family protein [Azonexus sp.]|uniref:dynamin family protein n=1 Tax=Azonexus sp. TaxID=1872668 RepID=UPI0027B93C9F|nr:dynamin family protein [Azonexus sp.]
MKLNPAELVERYALLCRSTQAGSTEDSHSLRLSPHLSALNKLVRHDLRALGRQGSPDDFADICFELEQELERFQEFCAFPDLAQKFVVAFGGGFSAGKSSLINALLGKRLLVTEVDPTTSLPTYLLRGDEDAIHAQNLFGQHIRLADEEFLSLTHDEFVRYGSNVSRLLRSAIISRSDFPWKNLTLIDTPGYTKHEDKRHGERTDEHIARTQLNSAQAIVWVIDARQGCITEDDIKFLTTLRPEIPRLFALSRADQKPAEDIVGIVAGIRATLEKRNLPFVDVVAVSARRKEWSSTPILEQLSRWNGAGRELRFAHNFKHQFTRYTRHLDDERRQAQQHLNRLNRILALADEAAVQQDAQELKLRAEGLMKLSERLHGEIVSLRHRFFSELKAIGDHVGIPLPEPSELDLLPDQNFDLLQALRRQREAEGKVPPDEPASLGDLAQPGDTPKLSAFLSGETDIALERHFAAGLDIHCREVYARTLVAVACYGKSGLTEPQTDLLLKMLESLGLNDIRTNLLAQVREMGVEDIQECTRIVKENHLGAVLLFDSLMLSRLGGCLASENLQLSSELGNVFGLPNETLAGISTLAGFVLGLRTSSNFTSGEVLKLAHWHPLFFRKVKRKDTKSGVVTGYFKQKEDIDIRLPDLSVKDAILICEGTIFLLPDGVFDMENSLICSQSSVYLGRNKTNISRSSIIANRCKGVSLNGYLTIGKYANISKSVFENWSNISYHSHDEGFAKIIDSSFNYLGKIEFDCSKISSILIRNCDFTLEGSEPMLQMGVDNSIYTPPKCKVVIEDCTFNYIGKNASDLIAIQLKETSIEAKGFSDKIEVIVSNTNVRREKTKEWSMLDTLRQFDPNHGYEPYALKWKEINFLISKDDSHGLKKCC